jgi:hypothetical protein
MPDPVLVTLQRARYAPLAHHQSPSPVPAATSTSCVLSRGGDGSKGTIVFWQRPKVLGEPRARMGPMGGCTPPCPGTSWTGYEAVSKAQVRSMEAFTGRCVQSLFWTFISLFATRSCGMPCTRIEHHPHRLWAPHFLFKAFPSFGSPLALLGLHLKEPVNGSCSVYCYVNEEGAWRRLWEDAAPLAR